MALPRCCWKDDPHAHRPYPREFREDRCPGRPEPRGRGLGLADITLKRDPAAISESCLNNWLRDADVRSGCRSRRDEQATVLRTCQADAGCGCREQQENEALLPPPPLCPRRDLPKNDVLPSAKLLPTGSLPGDVLVLKPCRQHQYRLDRRTANTPERICSDQINFVQLSVLICSTEIHNLVGYVLSDDAGSNLINWLITDDHQFRTDH